MRSIVRDVLLVGGVAAVVMFANLGGAPLWDRDEPRNAGCAWEMLLRNDWVTPVFNAELRTHKPVLLYWFIMSAYSLFGVSEFSARFWSASLAVGTTLCTYVMGRRLFRPGVGVWSGVILATALMFVVAGRAATPDATLIFFTTLAITIYVVGAFPREPAAADKSVERPYFPSWLGAVAMNLALGMAVLAKGPVGFVLPTAVIGMFLLIVRLQWNDNGDVKLDWRQRLLSIARVCGPRHFVRTCWSMRPLTALGAMLVVALPWYVWVGMRTDGEFLRGFFLEHNVSRAMHTMEGHRGSILFYPLAILAGFFPWSIFAVPLTLDATRHSRVQGTWRTGYLFAACWIGVYVGLFSLAQTKLPSYVTPCYPALALMAGAFVDRLARGEVQLSGWWLRAAFGSSVVVGLVLLVILPFVMHQLMPGLEWLAFIGLFPLVGGGLSWYLVERQEWRRGVQAFAVSVVVFLVCSFGIAAARVGQQQRYGHLLEPIESQRDDIQLASYGLLEPSWVFYGRQPVQELVVSGIAYPQTTWEERHGHWVPKPPLDAADILRRNHRSYFITLERYAEMLRAELPADFDILAEAPHFMRNGRVVLIGPRDSNLAERDSAEQERSLQR